MFFPSPLVLTYKNLSLKFRERISSAYHGFTGRHIWVTYASHAGTRHALTNHTNRFPHSRDSSALSLSQGCFASEKGFIRLLTIIFQAGGKCKYFLKPGGGLWTFDRFVLYWIHRNVESFQILWIPSTIRFTAPMAVWRAYALFWPVRPQLHS